MNKDLITRRAALIAMQLACVDLQRYEREADGRERVAKRYLKDLKLSDRDTLFELAKTTLQERKSKWPDQCACRYVDGLMDSSVHAAIMYIFHSSQDAGPQQCWCLELDHKCICTDHELGLTIREAERVAGEAGVKYERNRLVHDRPPVPIIVPPVLPGPRTPDWAVLDGGIGEYRGHRAIIDLVEDIEDTISKKKKRKISSPAAADSGEE